MLDNRSSKEKILKQVRKALVQKDLDYSVKLDYDSDVFTKENEEADHLFARNFVFNNGKFVYCAHEFHFLDQFLTLAEEMEWNNIICLEEDMKAMFGSCGYPFISDPVGVLKADVGITGCDALVSRTGSIIIS